MTTTKVSKATQSFDIKSALLSLESVVLRSDDIKQVETDLDARFAKHSDFFDNDPVMIDLTQIQESAASAALDLPMLCQILKKYKMNPVALRSNNPTHHAWAELAGLFLITSSQMPAEQKKSSAGKTSASTASTAASANPSPILDTELNSSSNSATSNTGLQEQANLGTLQSSPDKSLENSADPSIADPTFSLNSALIVDKPLRSGQHVYAKGRDLVVMAMVNPGAEIMADGHIHVYAPLRGKAIAGARGNKDARIYASCMEAELVSIAGIYRTSGDTPIPKEVAGKSAQIRLIDDKLVMQPK